MRRIFARASLVAPLWMVASACTDATLYDPQEVPSQPNKVAFTGQACTDNPAERSFPLRVVFVVDDSAFVPIEPPGSHAPCDDQGTACGAGETCFFVPPAGGADDGACDQNPNNRPPLVGECANFQDTNYLAASAAYQTQRVNAIRDEVQVLRAPDAAFALIRYGGDSQVAPDDGFTGNAQAIVEAAGALTVALPPTSDGSRRLSQALSLATSLISGDLLSTAKGPRSRTKYVVVLVQAGPTHDCLLATAPGICGVDCELATRVADLRAFVLDNGGADFQLHALDLSTLSGNPAVFLPTRAELERMSFAGAGEYKPLCNRDDFGNIVGGAACVPQTFALSSVTVNSARNVFLSKSFIVTNLNAISTNDGAVPDSDGDGLADSEEALYGVNPRKRDTDGDGIGDKIELLLSTVGVDPLTPDLPTPCLTIDPAQVVTLDTDGDGLTDCEEQLLRLDPTLFDSDADGTPDLLEVVSGTNFLEDDGLTDADFDGTPNNVELKNHTDPRSADAKARNELAYIYREIDLGIRDLIFSTQPRDLTGVTVDEISVGTTLGNAQISYDITPNGKQVLAWRDAAEPKFGPPVKITDDGVYTLKADCSGVQSCQRSATVSVSTAILPPFPVQELLRVSSAERQCTDFRVRNVTLVETLAADGKAKGANDVRIYFGEVPAEVPGAFGIFRVAQFPFTFLEPDTKIPNVADQVVDDFRFVLFE